MLCKSAPFPTGWEVSRHKVKEGRSSSQREKHLKRTDTQCHTRLIVNEKTKWDVVGAKACVVNSIQEKKKVCF